MSSFCHSGLETVNVQHMLGKCVAFGALAQPAFSRVKFVGCVDPHKVRKSKNFNAELSQSCWSCSIGFVDLHKVRKSRNFSAKCSQSCWSCSMLLMSFTVALP